MTTFVTPKPWGANLQHPSYGAIDTYCLAALWLEGCKQVADWGGAGGAFGDYLPPSVAYTVVDGTLQITEQRLADLVTFRDPSEGILLRHVLEINPEWRRIVDNLLASFTRRAVIVTYTPPFTKIKSGWSVAPVPLDEVRALVAPVLVREEAAATPDGEHVFYLERQT